MVIKKKFPVEYLRDMHLQYTALEEIIKSYGNKYVYSDMIFEDEGKYWKAPCYNNITDPYEGPWGWETEVECIQVELQKVMVEQWVPVEE